ncbi:MAG: YkgJ family cysteine cluster protein [Desulfovibrio sp.]
MTQQNQDETQAFLDSLPELKEGESFKFACHPEVPCFNACCSDLTLMLTPYDALRLRQGLKLTSRDFFTNYAEVSTMPKGGFPAVRLSMLKNERKSCPYVRDAGCSVYEDRPAACRTYPLGRATKIKDGEILTQFFVVKEPHCRGFEQEKEWTSDEWLKDQGLEPYNDANDRYMTLISKWVKTGKVLDEKMVNMAFLALYQPDDFKRFIMDMSIFKRLALTPEEQLEIVSSEINLYNFALEWLELVLLGTSEKLSLNTQE